jgi:uncharacterized membrane protein HdeD (DUF308 family)
MAGNKEQLRQTAAPAARVQSIISDRLGDVWVSYLWRGLAALALGFGALFWPKATIALLVQLVGIFAVLNGVASLFSAWQARLPGSYWLPAWLSLTVGAVLLFWPGVTVHLLFIIVGIWALIQGGSLWLMARETAADDPDRGLLTGIGVAGVLIGLVLAFWPGTGAVAISWVIAAVALSVGVVLVYLALHLRSAGQGINDLRR